MSEERDNKLIQENLLILQYQEVFCLDEKGPVDEPKRKKALEIIEQWMKEEDHKADKDFHDKRNADE
ncbi:hypothetical protein PAECIP111892_03128 [Paenibacillus auburnensis]|uniref:Uncharacterized protein n=1 Tax=Paenibacillus auburnensis TaxID=2905649 RepID=A0ABN8GGL2_9BACL|nr:hypothetical protein PAECIP111892_03128 [Paenibacillus auburnensis]